MVEKGDLLYLFGLSDLYVFFFSFSYTFRGKFIFSGLLLQYVKSVITSVSMEILTLMTLLGISWWRKVSLHKDHLTFFREPEERLHSI